eukprot:gene12003-12147_t
MGLLNLSWKSGPRPEDLPPAQPEPQTKEELKLADPPTTIIVKTADGSPPPSVSSRSSLASNGGISAYQPASALPVSLATAAELSSSKAKPRMFYIDWLRLFLTVLVVLHHCVTAYQTFPYANKVKNDLSLWLFGQLFVYGNQAYFMTLFFFISGIYVPASYKRKGAVQFLWDRTLRLVLPCLVYSMLFAPFLIWWNKRAVDPSASIAEAFQGWFKPGWPTTYVLPTGPPWFIWMLWCFNVAYAVLAILLQPVLDAVQRIRSRRRSSIDGSDDFSAQQLPKVDREMYYYSRKQWMKWGFIIIMVLFAVQYGTRMLDMFVFNFRPGTFIKYGPFVSFMPDYFPVYVVAFGLGTFSGPSKWNVLVRLPKDMAWWWLGAAGVWWVQVGWLPNVVLNSAMAMKWGEEAFVATWLLRTFVEQSFCVVWSAGLLVLFRECFNTKPGKVWSKIVNAAYGAYIVHPVVIALFTRAIAPVAFATSVCSAVAISGPVVFTTWVVAIAARAIPWADRVL